MSDEDLNTQEDSEIRETSPSPSSRGGEENGSFEELKKQNNELMNNWKRTAADFENYKKRKEQEGPEMMAFAKEITVAKLMPSLQNLEQVLKYAPEDEKYKDWLAGLRGTILQLEKDLEELGVRKIKTTGESFDPTRHEAVEETAGEPGKVIREIQPGFTLNDKVIIPAKVAVGKVINN